VTDAGSPGAGGAARAIEVVGPPGAGKSTLVAALGRCGDRFTVVPADAGAPSVLRLLSAATAVSRLAVREPDMRRIRWMARLEASAGGLERRRRDGALVLFDQGPVYTMARLWGSAGHPTAARPRYARWFDAKCSQWGELLDLVVLLDSADDVLLRRIRDRGKWHAVMDLPEDGALAELRRQRRAYEAVVAALGRDPTLAVVRLDSGQMPVEETVAATIAAVSARTNA
jgi:AAA domain